VREVKLKPSKFHDEWNYTIMPRRSPNDRLFLDNYLVYMVCPLKMQITILYYSCRLSRQYTFTLDNPLTQKWLYCFPAVRAPRPDATRPPAGRDGSARARDLRLTVAGSRAHAGAVVDPSSTRKVSTIAVGSAGSWNSSQRRAPSRSRSRRTPHGPHEVSRAPYHAVLHVTRTGHAPRGFDG